MAATKKDVIEFLSKKTNKSTEDIEKLYKQKEKEVLEFNDSLKGEKLEVQALSLLRAFLKTQTASDAPVYEGYLLGGSSVDDQFRFHRNTQKVELENLGFEKALGMGIVDKDGNLLFAKKAGYHKPGEKIPVLSKSNERKVPCVLKLSETSDELKPVLLRLQHKLDEKLPVLKKVSFRANGNFNDPYPTLYSADVTEFKVLDEKEESFAELAKKYYSKNILPPSKIFKPDGTSANITEETGTNIGYLVLTKGEVGSIRKDVTETSSVVEINEQASGFDDIIAQESNEIYARNVSCWVASDIPIDFASGSVVYVMGEAFTKNSKQEEGKRERQFNAYMIWADPKNKVAPKNKPQPIPPATPTAQSEAPKEDNKDKW